MTEEIAEVFFDLEAGDTVTIIKDGIRYEGNVRSTHGHPRDSGTYAVYVEREDSSLKLSCRINPAEPNVGIQHPYPEDGGAPTLYVDGESKGLVDELTRR